MTSEHEETRTPLLRPHSDATAHKFVLLTTRNLALAIGPLSTLIITLIFRSFPESGEDMSNHEMAAMTGVLVWMACWWVLGPIPIAITSLLPMVLFPFLKIMNSDAVAAEYTNSIVVLLLGTFILALGIQKHNFHKRVAMKILLVSGGEEMNPRYVILGFLSAAFFVSMWMSDTVAAVMLLPVAIGLLNSLTLEECDVGRRAGPAANSSASGLTDEEQGSALERNGSQKDMEEKKVRAAAVAEYGKGLILAVTYGTALGGMGTLIGSGPNVVLPGFYKKRYPNEEGLNFLSFCYFTIPLLVPYVIVTWLYLAWYFCPPSIGAAVGTRMNRRMVKKDYEALGPITFPEKVILAEFIVLIVLWITRVFGDAPGWGVIFEDFPSDGTVALLAAILLFVIPNKDTEGEMIMDWKSCKDLSWNVILLVGGGFALSKGIEESGLSTLIGVKLQFLDAVPYYLVTPVVTIILSIVTEFSSNVSVASVFLPILAEVAAAINYHPLLLMIPGTFACNFSYNLPSATPPNAIALGSGYVTVRDMKYPGLFMHIIGLLLISIFTPTLGAYVFGLNVPLQFIHSYSSPEILSIGSFAYI
ncbi:unnamed protein product [Calypogeia fissa]